jgi:hypothetical protein
MYSLPYVQLIVFEIFMKKYKNSNFQENLALQGSKMKIALNLPKVGSYCSLSNQD